MIEIYKHIKISFLTVYLNIINFLIVINRKNKKLIDNKIRIGIFILILKSSISANAQTFKISHGTCYLIGPTGNEKVHIQKYYRYHDFKIGTDLYLKDFYNSINISYGHNIKFANIGIDLNYIEDDKQNKATLLGAYLKLSPYSFSHITKHSRIITFHIITSLNLSRSVSIINSTLDIQNNTFNIGLISTNIYRNFAFEVLLAKDFYISSSFNKHLSYPEVGTHYTSEFYPKLSIHYLLKQSN